MVKTPTRPAREEAWAIHRGAMTTGTAIVREEKYQDAIELTARGWQWIVYHAYDSRRSDPGFPDLILCRGGRLVAAELKVGRGRVRPEQRTWLEALGQIGGPVEVKLWRLPEAWDDVIRTLMPEGASYQNGELRLATKG